MTENSFSEPHAYVVLWKDMERWVIPPSRFLQKPLPAGWTRVRIGDLVSQVSLRVKAESETEYKMAGVKWYGEGVFHRETVRGDEMSARQVTPLVPGALIYNRLFAWKESFAVVPPEFAGYYVSNEFPQFVPDLTRILPEYLFLFCTRDATLRAVNSASTGSSAVSRNRFKEDLFLKFEIPLPPLAEQESIVSYWRGAKLRIGAAKDRIERRVKEVEDQFLATLGLKRIEVGEHGKVLAVWWQDFERRGVSFNRQDRRSLDPTFGQFPVARLSELVADLENGWSPQCLSRPADLGEWGVLKLGAVSFGTFNENENKALPPTLKPIPALEVKSGQVLISRANITRLVGACAYIGRVRSRLMLSDKIFRVVFRENSRIEPAYLAEVMKIPQVRAQIESATTGTSATMQNITKPSLLALSLPLPPLPVQRQMIARSAAGRTEVEREREAAEHFARYMRVELESLILGTKRVSEA